MDDSPEGEDWIEKKPKAAAGCSWELEITASMAQPHYPRFFHLLAIEVGRMYYWEDRKASKARGGGG